MSAFGIEPEWMRPKNVDGEPMLSMEVIAVILGKSLSEVKSQLVDRASQSFLNLPASWNKDGRRRLKEYEAATGDDSLMGAVRYFYALEGLNQ